MLLLNPSLALESTDPKVDSAKFDNIANAECVSTHVSRCLILSENIVHGWLAPENLPHRVFELHVVFGVQFLIQTILG
jgi:hypothetical protein